MICCRFGVLFRSDAARIDSPTNESTSDVLGEGRPGFTAAALEMESLNNAWSILRSRPEKCSARVSAPRVRTNAPRIKVRCRLRLKIVSNDSRTREIPHRSIAAEVFGFMVAHPGNGLLSHAIPKAQPSTLVPASAASSAPAAKTNFREIGICFKTIFIFLSTTIFLRHARAARNQGKAGDGCSGRNSRPAFK